MKLALLLSALVALSLAGCTTNNNAPPATNSTSNNSSMGNMSMDAMPVVVTVGEGPTQDVPPHLYTMSPTKLTFHVGMSVNLTLKNTGMGPHDLTIQGIEGAKIASTAAGQTKSVSFTPTTAGTFKMYCDLGTAPVDHASNGMSGTVTVS